MDYTTLPEHEFLSAMWKAKAGPLRFLGIIGDPAAETMVEALWLRSYYHQRIQRLENENNQVS